jgi:hypothetical protein
MQDINRTMSSPSVESLTLSSSLGGYDTVAAGLKNTGTPPPSLSELWQQLSLQFPAGDIKYLVKAFKMTYIRAKGAPQETGLLLVPLSLFDDFPLLSLQHPTQVERQYSPSKWNLKDNELTIHIAYLIASSGWIVSLPDYPGMGDNYEVHPYCMSSLGLSVAAMIKADVDQSKWPWYFKLPWDGRTFLMGFSEGGYATMVAAKEIQANFPELNLIAATTLDGPYSLSVTMHDVMLNADKSFPAPYFLPYTVAGYGAGYPGIPELQFSNAIISEPPGFSTQLYKMLDGSYTAADITGFMQQAPNYSGPISVTSGEFQLALNTVDSTVNQTLALNDGYNGWQPANMPGKTLPLQMFHCPKDDLVPVGNADNAVAAWSGLPNVGFKTFDCDNSLGTYHAGAMLPAYANGIGWLESIAGQGRASSSANKLTQ